MAVISFIGAIFVGLFAFDRATPQVHLYVWDGIVVTFLFLWVSGLITELQRSEALSMEKFLHLPVSLTGVFVLNYLSSLLSVTLILFAPVMIGLCLGLVFAALGPMELLLLPLIAAFVLMVTAVTYQFQGWLASLMVNKRRRRTIVVIVTLVFVVDGAVAEPVISAMERRCGQDAGTLSPVRVAGGGAGLDRQPGVAAGLVAARGQGAGGVRFGRPCWASWA